MEKLMEGVESYGKIQILLAMGISFVLGLLSVWGASVFFRKEPRVPSTVCSDGKFEVDKKGKDGVITTVCGKKMKYKNIAWMLSFLALFMFIVAFYNFQIRNNPFARKGTAFKSLFGNLFNTRTGR